MPALEINPILLLILVTELVLLISIILFWRKLKNDQQKYILLVNESVKQFDKLLEKFKSFDQEVIDIIRLKISQTFDSVPNINEQLGKEGEEKLKKILTWQEREIKREQKIFIEVLKEKSSESIQAFDDSLGKLSGELREIVTIAITQAAKESSQELHNTQKQRIDELAKKTEGMLATISKKVLHKSLDQEAQQQLLMQALEEAWEQRILTDEKY